MPLNNAQLAQLVDRARLKAGPVVSPPPVPKPVPAEAPTQPTPPTPSPHQRLETTTATPSDDFPTGWELRKESWHFHRRFYAIFRRPMHRGEYSHLLWQIRRRTAEHLWEDCWRVTLPGGKTLAVRGSVWKLITILPKHWQPPQVAAQSEAVSA
jgi:hypothetical protein